MKHRILYLFLLIMGLGAFNSLDAQELSWRKHRKLAQQAESEGDYFTAAENYRMAWEKKQKKEELIYAKDAAESANKAKSDFLATMGGTAPPLEVWVFWLKRERDRLVF